uniref:Uncharacterized protein n=1 Tax=Anopheles farauti TaxID=69004 RepID=A0A182QMK4_9DIPT
MTLLGYLYIRTSRELRPPDGPLSIMMFEARAEARSRQIRLSAAGGRSGAGSNAAGAATAAGGRDNAGDKSASTAAAVSASANLGGNSRTYDLYDAEADVNREKRTQRHLGAMASSQVLCVCPLMILSTASGIFCGCHPPTQCLLAFATPLDPSHRKDKLAVG